MKGAHYLIYRPRKDERLSWPSWLTYSRWLTHIGGYPLAAGRAWDGKFADQRPAFYHSATQPAVCFFVFLCVRVLRIWISLPRIELAASNFAQPSVVHRRLSQRIINLCALCYPRSPKSDELANARTMHATLTRI